MQGLAGVQGERGLPGLPGAQGQTGMRGIRGKIFIVTCVCEILGASTPTNTERYSSLQAINH